MITFTDNFGPVLARALANVGPEMEKATQQNAYLLQAKLAEGIRRQLYYSNWPALKPKTRLQKAKKRQSDLTLVGEGELSSSFEVLPIARSTFAVGTNNPYARAQEFGYSPKNLPARPYFRPALKDATPEMLDNWKRVFGGVFKR